MKESILKTDKNLIFRETFGSEDLVRANGAYINSTYVSSFVFPTNFSNGTLTFNNSNNALYYNGNFKGVYSIRIRYASAFIGESSLPIIDFRDGGGTGLVYGNTPLALAASSGTAYINGVASTTTSSSTREIIISGITLSSNIFCLGKFSGSASYADGNTWELLEIYKGTLNDNEVKNLYENRQNRELQNSNGSVYKEILRVDARNGVISNKYSGNQYTELVTNGSFDTDTTWSKGTGWSIANGVATKVAGSAANLSQPATSASQLYRVIFTISNYSAGTINAQLSGGGGGTGTSRSANGTYIEDITSGSAAGGNFYLVASSTFAGDIDNVSVKEIIPTITNTSVTTQKSGPIYAMDFNGSTSKIDCGSYDTLVGNKTFVAWIRMKRPNPTGTEQDIITNDRFRLFYNNYSDRHLYFTSIGVGNLIGGLGPNAMTQWRFITITRTSTGISSVYVDNTLIGFGTSGTPTIGTNNITIGGLSKRFNGLISNVRIIDGILSTAEITQLWQDEKSLYNL